MKRLFILIVISLALTACSVYKGLVEPAPMATDTALANMPNPASVFCEQQGNTLKIQTAADGSQSGICIFPDGSSCDEWAYYRGECGPTAPTSTEPVATAAATIEATQSAVEDALGGYMPPGTTETIADWWGVIKCTEPGAQYDDFFERQDLGQMIYFGITASDPAVQAQIELLRDSGKVVHLYGTLLSNVPDYNGSQIQVDRIVVDG